MRCQTNVTVFSLLVLMVSLATADPVIPDDPEFPRQWALHNVGQVVEGEKEPGLAGADIGATDAWTLHQGASSVVVAIVGTGVNPHVEFADRLLEGRSTVGDPYNSLDTWPTGPFGTFVAGVIGATSNNGIGVAGVSRGVRILPVRTIETVDGDQGPVAEGIVWAVDQGAQIVVVPLQFAEGAQVLEDAVDYAVQNDVLVIAPTGKDGDGFVSFPAAFDGCLAVASTTHRDEWAPFSNYGSQVDLAAPGRNIVSTWRDDGFVNLETAPGAAAGFVAGAAALVLSYSPQLNPLEVGQLLVSTSVDLGDSGWDSFFGAGRLNIFSALQQAPLPALRFEHPEPMPTAIMPGVMTRVTVRIVDGAETVVPGLVTLHYRIADGSEQSVNMNALGQGVFGVDLPPTPCEETLSYYFQAVGDGQTVVFDPIDAPARSYRAFAVQESILFFDDFESDQGWETIVEGVGTKGGWVRTEPIGTIAPTTGSAAQPDYDRSPDDGAICFITGQNPGGAAATDDVDGGPVRLISPSVTVGESDVEVRYALWHHTSVGDDPDVLIVEFSRDNGVSWHEVESVTQTDDWEWHSFRLSEFPNVTGDSLRVRFSVADLLSDPSLTESAVDEFLVREIRCDLADGDFDGNGVIDQLDYAAFSTCMSGPANTDLSPGCGVFDFDTSGGVDLQDARTFQNRYNP